MASGYTISKEAAIEIQKMTNPVEGGPRVRFVVFELTDKEIVPTHVHTQCELEGKDAFEVLKTLLKPSSCCYILYDCQFAKMVTPTFELVLISWCDDTAHIRKKLTYAASMGCLKKALTGVKHFLQVNCLSDIVCRKQFAKMLGNDLCSVEGVAV